MVLCVGHESGGCKIGRVRQYPRAAPKQNVHKCKKCIELHVDDVEDIQAGVKEIDGCL